MSKKLIDIIDTTNEPNILRNMEWQELKPDNLPKKGIWVLITDGIDWRRVFVTNQYEFAEHPDDRVVYSRGITHWCEVTLP